MSKCQEYPIYAYEELTSEKLLQGRNFWNWNKQCTDHISPQKIRQVANKLAVDLSCLSEDLKCNDPRNLYLVTPWTVCKQLYNLLENKTCDMNCTTTCDAKLHKYGDGVITYISAENVLILTGDQVDKMKISGCTFDDSQTHVPRIL